MIFLNGLPRISGASDMQDSSHLAGILAVFGHPQAVCCTRYVLLDNENKWYYVRCPFERGYDLSRDQGILLMSGMLAQGERDFVRTNFIDGKDLLPPSVRGLEAIAKTGKASWLSHWWLKREIAWHSNLQPLEEPFQIIALCISYDRAHGTKYLKLWTESNKLWRWSIRRYLAELDGAWRDEKELCDFVIKRIEEMVTT
jgi:hypothetical protein